jgi:hypothetical protein
VRNPRRVARHAAVAFLVHGALAVAVLALERRPGGANIFGWDAVRFLRLADLPVVWAIDGILQRFLLVPVGWFQPNFELAYAVNVALTYVLVGGAFYAALAAGVSLWFGGRRPTGNGVTATNPMARRA